MKNQRNHTRRALLAASASLMTPLVAGCLTAANSDTPSETTTDASGTTTIDDESPISRAYATGTHLVIELDEDRPVSQVNLIGPDGTAYARRSVARGARKLRIRLLSHDSWAFSDSHYSQGEHTVVAVGDDQVYRRKIELRPSLRLLSAEAIRYDDHVKGGNISLMIENIGSAPTWIRDIAYEDSPSWRANTELEEDINTPRLKSPLRPTDQLIPPNETQRFVGLMPPLRLPTDEYSTCSGQSTSFSVKIGTAIGRDLIGRLTVRLSGTLQEGNVWDLCSDSNVELDNLQEALWD